MSKEELSIEKLACLLYNIYCESVGGKSFNGDTLPSWEVFAKSKDRQKQVQAWREVATKALEYIIDNSAE